MGTSYLCTLLTAATVLLSSCGKKSEEKIDIRTTEPAKPSALDVPDRKTTQAATLARLPDDADNGFLLSSDFPSEGSEALTAVTALLLTELPYPDALVLHGVAHSTHQLVFQSLGQHYSKLGLVWYDGWDFGGAIPRAFGAMLAAHTGLSRQGGCEEDQEGLRQVKGLMVHGDDEMLYNTVCLDDQYSVHLSSEYSAELVDRAASGKLGKSPIVKLLDDHEITDEVWAAAAWSSASDSPAYGIDAATLSSSYDRQAEASMVIVRLRPATGHTEAVDLAIAAARDKLTGATARLFAATKIDRKDAWITMRFVIDDGLAKQLYDQVPDDLAAFQLITRRQSAAATRD